jgi:hypothetical protein
MAHDKNAWSNHALDHIIPDADRSVYVNSAFQYNSMESNLVQPMSTYLQLGQNNQVLLNHDRYYVMLNQDPMRLLRRLFITLSS